MLRAPALLVDYTELPAAELYLVAGPAASGKTTFAKALAQHLNATILSLDNYYLDEDAVVLEYDERYGHVAQWDSPEAFDLLSFQQNIRDLIQTGQAQIPSYSFAKNCRDGFQTLTKGEGQALIIEGLYSIRFQPLLEEITDSVTTIFVQAERETRWVRRRIRDLQERGKVAEDFERRYHFVTAAEQRWLLEQEHHAEYILATDHPGFSYEKFFQ
ncbi:uridine kinase family protein [Tengunoibacter tsumagoiensis]|uniref:Phosphoribulokinase/uridine kinase domain-containing protein n=1 Tax=Tengunoibacter tsumagoiensis TaxID=2014871 RepID=A0A401ZZF0_9CHLR|nr:AAA family ATPase [Tengunoibacter tsumagoiensis]GCE12229.1 hypothetical protein KTT_20880 [Tengunoibacter tsumagoiensis]